MTHRRHLCRLAGIVTAAMVALPAAAQELRAQLDATRSTVLSSALGGRIAELTVRDGERFQQGQVLVRLDCAVHEAEYARVKAQAERARVVVETNRQLARLDSASTLQVAIAEAELRAAEAEIELSRAIISRCTLRAPFDGRVAEAMVKAHQHVAEGQALLDILDDSALEVAAIVPSRLLPRLLPGLEMTVEVDETGGTYRLRLARVAGRVDPVSQSVRIFAELVDGPQDLTAGMSGRLRLPATTDPASPGGSP